MQSRIIKQIDSIMYFQIIQQSKVVATVANGAELPAIIATLQGRYVVHKVGRGTVKAITSGGNYDVS